MCVNNLTMDIELKFRWKNSNDFATFRSSCLHMCVRFFFIQVSFLLHNIVWQNLRFLGKDHEGLSYDLKFSKSFENSL